MRAVDVLSAMMRATVGLCRLRTATIDSFTATKATITLAGGTVVDVPYLKSYTPGIGDNVLVLQTADGRLLIIGEPA